MYNFFLGGRRTNVSLEKILTFITGVDEEPILGFELHPSVVFFEVDKGFIPSSQTCINQLKLPIAYPVPSLVFFCLSFHKVQYEKAKSELCDNSYTHSSSMRKYFVNKFNVMFLKHKQTFGGDSIVCKQICKLVKE